jgi:hypothetical protein
LGVALVEREGELAALRGLMAALSSDGCGGVALVEGPAGIGKSALLDAALEGAAATVLRAGVAETASAAVRAGRDVRELEDTLMGLALRLAGDGEDIPEWT